MKCLSTKKTSIVALAILFVCLNGRNWYCFGEEDSAMSSEILAPMAREEQEGLYSVVRGFVGKWWNGSDLYPDPCGWTPIQGVSCDLFNGLWYVTALSIGSVLDNSLRCTTQAEFAPQLFDLNHLKSLSFFNCFVSHPVSIPTRNWAKLADTLESMEFRSNPGLVGEIPPGISSLTKLKSLVLIDNGLTGQIPASIGDLISLEKLVLAGNKLTGQIPAALGDLSRLLIVDLSRNSLSGHLPLTLGGLTSLLKLDLSHNLLRGNLPSEIGEMRSLTLLDLGNNRLSGGLGNASGLGKLKSLEQMVLSNNPIGGDLKGFDWEKLECLAVLELSNTDLSGEIPESISSLKSLRFLGLSENNLSGNLSPSLAALPCVGALYINRNNLSGELGFSGEFYGKMGRRFGAWDNPNLCYPVGSARPDSDVPFGVKPCRRKAEPRPNSDAHSGSGGESLNDRTSHLVASFGLSGNGVSLELVVLVIMFLFYFLM